MIVFVSNDALRFIGVRKSTCLVRKHNSKGKQLLPGQHRWGWRSWQKKSKILARPVWLGYTTAENYIKTCAQPNVQLILNHKPKRSGWQNLRQFTLKTPPHHNHGQDHSRHRRIGLHWCSHCWRFAPKCYNGRGTVRSETTAAKVKQTHSKYQAQLSFALVTDIGVADAFDEAVKGVDGVSGIFHLLHALNVSKITSLRQFGV